MFLSRRGFVGGTAAITLASSAPQSVIGETTDDLAAPENLLELYRAMRGGIGDEPALWWLTGTVYAKVIGKTNVPLVQVHGASWNKLTDAEGGNLAQAMDEAGYFADVDNGEIIDAWVNPINGHEAKPEGYRTVSQQIITPNSVERANTPIAVEGTMRPATISNGIVWVHETFSATVPSFLTGGAPRVMELMATFQARTDEVDLAAQRHVPCTLSFLQVDPFYDWMGMPEDEPGLLLWRLVGRKLKSAAEIPAFLAQRLETDHPGFLTKPQL